MNTMIGKLALLAVLVAAVRGNAVVQSGAGLLNNFFLYTRDYDHGRTPFLLPSLEELNQGSDAPYLDSSVYTVVLVHGHGGDSTNTLNPLIKNAFLDGRSGQDINTNVIIVDWSVYTQQSYSLASSAVPSVGTVLGRYLKFLHDINRINVDLLHLIGFNLGAHVVGFAGRVLHGEAARITGLDPSGRGWGPNSPRLSKSDARYVEVIHTDGYGLLANGIGTNLGDVDFFVNGGSNQPGCLTRDCSHRRAYELFTATLVRETPLIGNACNSNLQLTLNLCRGISLAVGGADLIKLNSANIYRVNTGRTFPY